MPSHSSDPALFHVKPGPGPSGAPCQPGPGVQGDGLAMRMSYDGPPRKGETNPPPSALLWSGEPYSSTDVSLVCIGGLPLEVKHMLLHA